ncbi:hypothetical protein [Streptomyces sp. BK022]|nr:hypothetical protein [Streptomyces sp. BK022]
MVGLFLDEAAQGGRKEHWMAVDGELGGLSVAAVAVGSEFDDA